MTFSDFYEPPFWTDGIYIWSNNGNMALMASDISTKTETVLKRTCEILNGSTVPQKEPALEYKAPDIFLDGEIFLTVRGWGGLKNHCKTEEEAAKIQDEFGAWVVNKLRGK